jgi:8-oxo-dGTP diphosphatase
MKKIEVVAAIIYFENKILCVQRPKNKLLYISESLNFQVENEQGETQKEALKRELLEELDNRYQIFISHSYPSIPRF